MQPSLHVHRRSESLYSCGYCRFTVHGHSPAFIHLATVWLQKNHRDTRGKANAPGTPSGCSFYLTVERLPWVIGGCHRSRSRGWIKRRPSGTAGRTRRRTKRATGQRSKQLPKCSSLSTRSQVNGYARSLRRLSKSRDDQKHPLGYPGGCLGHYAGWNGS